MHETDPAAEYDPIVHGIGAAVTKGQYDPAGQTAHEALPRL